ncbi:MAG: VOC family protein [Sulfitobacter sp.]
MSTQTIPPFHLAFPVDDLEAARHFYKNLLGCTEGRSSENWVDFNFRGHQIVAHYAPEELSAAKTGKVDGQNVPVRHAGIVMEMDDWQATAKRLKDEGIQFVIEPYIRFEGEPGEQATMFFNDPAGNAIELKSFKDIGQLFAK